MARNSPFTYGNEKLKDRVEPLAASVGSKIVLPLDVTIDSQTDAVFAALGSEWGSLDILVHAVAFAPREGAGPVISSTALRARPLPSRTMCRATASLPSPGPPRR